MMLKTFSRKTNPAFGMFKSTLKKNIGISILMCVGVLIYCPGYFISNPDGLGDMLVYENRARVFCLLLGIFGCAAVMLYNLINFTFLYSKRSSDVFGALPLERTELLLSRCFAGYVLAAAPVVVGISSLIILKGIMIPILETTEILRYLLIILSFMLATLAFSAFFVICVGSAFDLIVSFICVNLGLVLTAFIVTDIVEEFLVGYVHSSMSVILKILSPFVYFVNYVARFEDVSVSQTVQFLVYSVVMFAGFGTASVLLFKKRKFERSGQAYAFKFFYYVCAFLVSLCAGFALGGIFSEGEYNLIFWIFGLIGAVFAVIVFALISKRGFKQIKSSVITGCISMSTLGLVVVISVSGSFGYKNRVPSPESVKSVDIRISGDTALFKDADLAVEMHSSILKNNLYRTGPIYDYDDGENYMTVNFNYTLKNGRELKRQYYIRTDNKKTEGLIDKYYRNHERFESFLNASKYSSDKIIDIYTNDNQAEFTSSYLHDYEVEELLEIYQRELKNSDSMALAFYEDETGFYRYELRAQNTKDWRYNGLSLYINGYDFPETREYLDSLLLRTRENY